MSTFLLFLVGGGIVGLLIVYILYESKCSACGKWNALREIKRVETDRRVTSIKKK